jgi:Lon protease-like protein
MKRMYSLADLPQTIPVFPLTGALLLPHARLPLNIFEPRYLTMLDDVLKSDTRLIGMIQPRDMPEGTGTPSLQQIGCAGRVTSFSETEDGRYLITLSGICRFRLIAQNTGFTPYLRGDVDWASFQTDIGKPQLDHDFDRPAFLETLQRFFDKAQLETLQRFFDKAQLSTDWDSLRDADEEMLINSLSMLCPFNAEEKQALLEAPCLKTRRETLVTLMEFAMRDSDEGPLQ